MSDAEKAVLGAMLMSPEAITDVAGIVRGGDFYHPAHGLIFDTIVGLETSGKPADQVTVVRALDATGDLGRVGGAAYVTSMPDFCPAASSAGYYAEEVRDSADLRAVRAAGIGLQQVGETAESADVAKAQARKILDDLDSRSTGQVVTLGDVIAEALDVDRARPRLTPWRELDRVLAGLRPGALYTIGARPGQGKSVIGCNIAWNTACGGGRVALFSLEMPRHDVSLRIASAAAEVDYSRLLNGSLNGQEQTRIAAVMDRLMTDRLVIDERTSLTVADVRATCRALARTGLDLVVIDYLQLMGSGRKSENRQQEVSEISRALKILAGDLSVPVVILAQLNRSSETRADRRPLMSDLRESGAVEQDSDSVGLLFRDEKDSPDELEFIIAKNRYGRTGRVKLTFEGRYQRVVSRQSVAS